MKSSITSNDRYPITHTFQPRTDSNSKWKFEDKYNYPAKIISLILITLNKLRKFKNKNKRYKIKLIVGFSLAKKLKQEI